ncbi:Kae1-associated serine/threonine protein kinase [Candidatus Pacearchaeota archaeon]|nr:Kae1-associated serine/threonine protein kinase [Candidatus Pacearchaeota archaeon]
MKDLVIGKGAEAIITKKDNLVVKDRIEKSYRYPDLDKKLRKLRTRAEAKILEKTSKLINTPKIISSDELKGEIEMEYIDGKKLADHLEETDYKKVSEKIGEQLAKLHDNNIIHGDLTTSNLILNKKNEVYFIDFGLGFHSSRIEDKAVDLHLIKQALEAKHPSIHEECYNAIIKSYKKSKNQKATLAQLEKVEKRGRYKAQY